MLFKLKPVYNEIDLGIFGGESLPSVPYSLYDWLNEEDEENEDD